MLTLGKDGHLLALLRKLDRQKVDIAALSIFKQLGSGLNVVEAYSYLWSGLPGAKLRGVAVAISG